MVQMEGPGAPWQVRATVPAKPLFGAGVSARSNYKIVFELTLVAVIDQVNSGIDVLVPYLGVRRNIGAPFLGIIADKVVDLARQFTQTHHRRFSARAHKIHPHRSFRRRLEPQVWSRASSMRDLWTEEELLELRVLAN